MSCRRRSLWISVAIVVLAGMGALLARAVHQARMAAQSMVSV